MIEDIIGYPKAVVSGIVQIFNTNYDKDIGEIHARQSLSKFDRVEIAVRSAIMYDIPAAVLGSMYLVYDGIKSRLNHKR